MTVATVPFIAIKEETYVKALTSGLHAVDYQPGYEGTIPLLLVSLEHAITDTFKSFLRSKHNEKVLHRIIIDEAHVIVTDGCDFKACLDYLHWITELSVPISALTATFPGHFENEFQQCFAVCDENDRTTTRSPPRMPSSANMSPVATHV